MPAALPTVPLKTTTTHKEAENHHPAKPCPVPQLCFGFVEASAEDAKELLEGLGAREYETKTRGEWVGGWAGGQDGWVGAWVIVGVLRCLALGCWVAEDGGGRRPAKF